jgi:hypothetical protein
MPGLFKDSGQVAAMPGLFKDSGQFKLLAGPPCTDLSGTHHLNIQIVFLIKIYISQIITLIKLL